MSNAAIVRPFLAKNGVDNNGNKITNLSSPIAATDGANKTYVDSSISTATSLLVNNSSLGVNNGVATLDTTGKVPVSQVSNSINVPLTAYGSTTGTITATDTILTAIEKLNGNLAAATAGGVSAISISNSNGFTGTSSGGSTPILTLGTSVTGLLKGNGITLTQAVQSDVTGLLGAGSITNTMLANSAIANLSGTNTGDQTNITGNAGTVTNGIYTTTVNAAVLASALTGYGSTTGIITAADTILTAIEKLNGNLAAATAGNGTLTLVNGAETSISLTTSTLTSNQIVDTFLISNVRSVKYLIQVSSLGNSYYQMSELLAIHDGTNPYISEINTILTNSAVATFSADINGANFELLVTPLYTNLSIKIIRTTINS